VESINKVNLQEKESLIQEHWKPGIVAALNGQHVKLAKLKGEFVWHQHDQEDEMFLIIKGSLDIEFRDKTLHLEEGELVVVPKGVQHRPVAKDEVTVLLFEPESTINTGDEKTELTREKIEWL
jgi:mannose-6-phosphate isomerase-like protein (cupin superfamily)